MTQGPPPSRVLLRSPNWLGDAVMASAALEKLAQRYPKAELHVLAPAKLADIWASHPAVAGTLTIAPAESPWSVGRRLRPLACDLALIFPNSARSALEVFLGRIPRRIGYAGQWRNLFLTEPVARRPEHMPMRKRSADEVRRLFQTKDRRTRFPPSAHHVLGYLHLASVLGADAAPVPPRLNVTPEERRFAAETFLPLSPGGTPPLWLGLNPGAEYGPAKRWPVERFSAVAREFSARHREGRWLLFGGAADKPLCDAIAAASGPAAVNLAGRTTLRQLMALLAQCRVLLTNDTGPMHLAAALGTPVVALFGSTSPELTGPGLPGEFKHHLLSEPVACAPCFLRQCPVDLRCLTSLSSDRVVSALEAALRPGVD